MEFNLDKKQNAMMLDKARFEMAKQLPVVPGGPMNTNPENFTSYGPQSSSLSGINKYPYGDSGVAAPPQLGADSLNPVGIPPSKTPKNNPAGRGLNNNFYGMQPQPEPQMQDSFEGARLAVSAKVKGLTATKFLGATGTPTPIPGGIPPNLPNTTGRPLMKPMTSMNPMTPGSTPKKIKKGKK